MHALFEILDGIIAYIKFADEAAQAVVEKHANSNGYSGTSSLSNISLVNMRPHLKNTSYLSQYVLYL